MKNDVIPWYAIPGYTPQRWHPATALYAPIYRWKKPRVILVDDIFADGWLGERRDRAFAAMALCRRHMFVLVTKHPDTAWRYLSDEPRCLVDWQWATNTLTIGGSAIAPVFPLPNLWIGTHVETQAEANYRVQESLFIKAARHFVHVTLREMIRLDNLNGYRFDVHNALRGQWEDDDDATGSSTSVGHTRKIDWVVVEGGSDPMHPDHVRSLRDQCVAAGVPFRFAGWGKWAPGKNFPDYIPSGQPHHFNDGRMTDDEAVWQVGSLRSGRLLDGVEHDAMPEVGGGKQ